MTSTRPPAGQWPAGRRTIARRPREQGKLPVRERVALLLDPGSFAEEGLLAGSEQDGLGAEGVVTGIGMLDGPPGGGDGQRPDRQGRLVGAADGREDPPHPGARAVAALPARVSGRFGRCAHQPAGPDVPRPPPRRADLLQPGAAVRRGSAGLPAVRPERRRRRLHPGLLRHRRDARRQRIDVSRVPPHGRDGDR